MPYPIRTLVYSKFLVNEEVYARLDNRCDFYLPPTFKWYSVESLRTKSTIDDAITGCSDAANVIRLLRLEINHKPRGDLSDSFRASPDNDYYGNKIDIMEAGFSRPFTDRTMGVCWGETVGHQYETRCS